MRSLLPLAGAVLTAYLLLCGLVYTTQRSQIYFPSAASDRNAAVALWLESQGQRILVWTLLRPNSRALIYFGGNAEDVGMSLDVFARAFPAHSLYLVNYRGYGGSSGRPSEAAITADAFAVFDYVSSRHDQVSVMGRSLGSGVAVRLASERPVDRIVLVTPFDSLVNLAQEHFRWLPVSLLLRDRYEAAGRASLVTAPVLLVIAGEDEIVPRRRSMALAEAFPRGQAKVVIAPDVGHNTLDLSPVYLESVREFLDPADAR